MTRKLGEIADGYDGQSYAMPDYAVALFFGVWKELSRIYWNREQELFDEDGQDDPKITIDAVDSLAPGDAFVLCSDGLWAYFDDAELGAIIDGQPARKASEMLIDLARQRAAGGGDNLSLVIIKLVEVEPAPGAPPGSAVRR